jgi:hypothetical protein
LIYKINFIGPRFAFVRTADFVCAGLREFRTPLEQRMSRHHLLPPLAYAPPPQPKKVENRKRRIHAGDVDELEKAAEVDDATAASRRAPAVLQPNLLPIEGSERKPRNPGGRLSEDTLKAILEVQEFKQA